MNNLEKSVAFLFFAMAFLVTPVAAYWDAGTFTLIWQAIAGFALVLLYIIKTKWHQVKSYIQKLRK